MTPKLVQLDPTQRHDDLAAIEEYLRAHVVGQSEAVSSIVECLQLSYSGLANPRRPIANILMLGPTGSGKTRIVEALSEAIFGDPLSHIKVDCAEFQHSHEIAKLIGSPPGYLGHRETHPIFTQEAVNQYHTEDRKLTLVLFDEIEKGSDALWNLLLGVMDKGRLRLGDNRQVDMSSCMIFMTSNLGAKDMEKTGDGYGFSTGADRIAPNLDGKLHNVAMQAARGRFSPEFINRLDKSVVFKTLTKENLESIVEIELGLLQRRILQNKSDIIYSFACSGDVKKLLLEEGFDTRYGARHLRRAIDKRIVFPLSNLMATGQIEPADAVYITMESGALRFQKIPRQTLVNMTDEELQDLKSPLD